MTILLGSSFKTVKAICTFARHLCDFLKGASAEKYREVQSTVRILNEVSTYVEIYNNRSACLWRGDVWRDRREWRETWYLVLIVHALIMLMMIIIIVMIITILLMIIIIMVTSMIITIALIMLMMILMVVIIIIDLTHYGDYDENYHARNLGINEGSGD